MGTIAKHDVKKDCSCSRIVYRFLHTLDTLRRIDHRMRLALCISVVSKVNHDVAVQLKHISFNILRRHLAVHSVFDQHSRFIGKCSS